MKHLYNFPYTLACSGLVLFTLGTVAQAQSVYNPSLNEYQNSTAVVQLGIKGIHSKGIIGQGVVVAVLDTGLNLNNPEFKGNSRVRTGYNAVNGSRDVTDSMGHGTHVAGIIAASANGSGMYGVAPGATLLPIKVFNGNTASSTDIDRGLMHAVSQGAKVINLSLGANGPTGNAGLIKVASTNNTLVLAAAGNSGAANPGWPARYAKDAWANGTIIAVGAVDANKKLASFSNKAGDTANFYLVAPGVNIISSYSSGYAYMSGTSMATPAVAGAAALLFGYWPYLKANQVSAILLNTTDDLGARGVDAIYGRGMLNVNRALSPQGSYSYKASNGRTVTIALNTRVTSATQPRVSSPSSFGGLSTEVFDDYGRNFTSDEGAAMASRSQLTLDALLGRSDQLLDTAERLLPDGSQVTSLRSTPGASRVGLPEAPAFRTGLGVAPQSGVSMVRWQWADGRSFTAGEGGLSAMGLGLMNSPWAARLGGVEALLMNPLTQFAPNHRFAATSMPLAAGWTARVGLVRGQSPSTGLQNSAQADVNLIELMHQGRFHAINVATGRMNEQGLLGGYSNGALGLAQQTRSQGTTVSGALALTSRWTLAGAITRSQTAAPTANGLLLSGTPVASDAWGLGLVKTDTWRRGDRLSLALHAPLRARSGSLTYSVVTGVNPDDGSPVYGTHTVNLRPAKREMVAEARYVTYLSNQSSLTAVAAYRQHPDHDATAASQTALGVRYQLAF